jgi:hypothetical protein
VFLATLLAQMKFVLKNTVDDEVLTPAWKENKVQLQTIQEPPAKESLSEKNTKLFVW